MLNTVTIMGRHCGTPELKHTPNGVAVTSFTLAVDRDYKSGENKQADFISCVAWRNTAEFICKYFDKGAMMAATGSLQTRSYTANDGSKRSVAEVLVDRVYFAGGRDKNATQGDSGNNAGVENTNDFEELELSDDLPF